MRPLSRTGNPFIAVCTAALLFVGNAAWVPAFAAADPNTPTDPIGQMEVKYFEHTYPNDTQEQRLDRLEKLVFGEIKTGSDDERVSSLLAAIPNLSAAPTQDAGSSGGSQAPQSSGQDQTATGQDQGGQDDSGGTAADYSDYPSVTALEQYFFHKSFQGEPVKHRLDQLESKAFGHVNAVGDLSDRVDKLEEYARKQNHGVGVDPTSKIEAAQGSNGLTNQAGQPQYGAPQYGAPQYGAPQFGTPQYNTPTPPPGWQSAGAGLNATIDQMEQREFGRTFAQSPLLDRVKQLEARVFPNEVVDAQASIPDRVNTLMHAVQLSGGTQQGAYPGYASTQGQTQPHAPYYGNPAYNPNAYASAAPQAAYGGASGMYGTGQTQYAQPQYGQPQYSQPQYGQPQYGTAGNTGQYQQAAQQQQQQPQQHKGHPLIAGLAKVLGAVGGMALNSMGSMNFGGGGYGMPYGGYPTGVGGFWP